MDRGLKNVRLLTLTRNFPPLVAKTTGRLLIGGDVGFVFYFTVVTMLRTQSCQFEPKSQLIRGRD